MKTNPKILFVACLSLLVGMLSCNNNDDIIDSGDKAIPTNSVSLTLRVVNAASASAEDKITTADVFVYDMNGRYLCQEALSATDFSVASGEHTTTITVPNGEKQIFVGANLPAGVAASLEGKTLDELKQMVVSLNQRSQLASENNGITMTALKDYLITGDNNNVYVELKRVVAKVSVQLSEDVAFSGAPGALANISFAINNYNKNIFLLQGDAPDYKDPNWNEASYNANQFLQAQASDYIPVNEPNQSNLRTLYASENTSEKYRAKELTYVSVRAIFLPEEITVRNPFGGADYVILRRETSSATPQTFYAILQPGTRFFLEKDVADAYAIENNIPAENVLTYADGYCYWNIYLNQPHDWDVYRNDYYKCIITSIECPGRYAPGIVGPIDPESPPLINAMATANVVPWYGDKTNHELEP